MAQTPSPAPCVVLTRHAGPLSTGLSAALHAHGLTPEVTDSEIDAMVRLLLLERASREHRLLEPISTSPAAGIVLVDHPMSCPECKRMLSALCTYAPRVHIWQFIDGALVPLHEPDKPDGPNEPTIADVLVPPDDADVRPARPRDENSRDAPDQTVVTQEEIALLLRDADDEQDALQDAP